jgi:hypothetical protein
VCVCVCVCVCPNVTLFIMGVRVKKLKALCGFGTLMLWAVLREMVPMLGGVIKGQV